MTSSDLGPAYPPVEQHPCSLSQKKTNLSTCHFGSSCQASVSWFFVTMVDSDGSLTLSMSVSLAVAWSDALHLATLSRSSAPRRYQRRTIGRLLLTEQEVLEFQRTIIFTTSCRNLSAKLTLFSQLRHEKKKKNARQKSTFCENEKKQRKIWWIRKKALPLHPRFDRHLRERAERGVEDGRLWRNW